MYYIYYMYYYTVNCEFLHLEMFAFLALLRH